MHVQPIQFTKPFNIKCYYGNAKHKQHKTFPMCSNTTNYINKIFLKKKHGISIEHVKIFRKFIATLRNY